jgi:hypothetical protein
MDDIYIPKIVFIHVPNFHLYLVFLNLKKLFYFIFVLE